MSDNVLPYSDGGDIEDAEHRETLLGVVEPSTSDYDEAVQMVTGSLDAVARRLRSLRDERSAINVEIKRLVGHEKILQSMVRIARHKEDGE